MGGAINCCKKLTYAGSDLPIDASFEAGVKMRVCSRMPNGCTFWSVDHWLLIPLYQWRMKKVRCRPLAMLQRSGSIVKSRVIITDLDWFSAKLPCTILARYWRSRIHPSTVMEQQPHTRTITCWGSWLHSLAGPWDTSCWCRWGAGEPLVTLSNRFNRKARSNKIYMILGISRWHNCSIDRGAYGRWYLYHPIPVDFACSIIFLSQINDKVLLRWPTFYWYQKNSMLDAISCCRQLLPPFAVSFADNIELLNRLDPDHVVLCLWAA